MSRLEWMAVLLTVGLSTAALPVESQEAGRDQILFGGIVLSLGTPTAAVLKDLGPVYDLEHLDEVPGTWTVFRRGADRGSENALGVLQFQNDRLSFVNKWWRPRDSSGSALAEVLYQAIESAKGGQTDCRIGTTTLDTRPNDIRVDCGARTLIINLAGDGMRTVQEILVPASEP